MGQSKRWEGKWDHCRTHWVGTHCKMGEGRLKWAGEKAKVKEDMIKAEDEV